MTRYSNGANRERRLLAKLTEEDQSDWSIRAAGSHGIADIILFKSRKTPNYYRVYARFAEQSHRISFTSRKKEEARF